MPSKRKRLQGRLIAWALPRIQRWFSKAPYLKALARGEAIGRLIWRLAKRRRKTGEANLAMAFPELSKQECAAICKRVFENFGRSSADFFFGLNRTLAQLEATTTVIGSEHFLDARSKGKGVLVVSGHFGNFERTSAWATLQGIPLSVVARDANDEGVNKLINDLRKGPGTRVISRGKAARQIIERLRKNEVVGILADQNANETFIPFFGKPAGTVLGPGVLAERTGSPVVPVFCHYVGEGNYVVRIYPELTAEPGYATKGEGMMRAINAILEEVIREHPDQWLWFHDRWRTARRKGLL